MGQTDRQPAAGLSGAGNFRASGIRKTEPPAFGGTSAALGRLCTVPPFVYPRQIRGRPESAFNPIGATLNSSELDGTRHRRASTSPAESLFSSGPERSLLLRVPSVAHYRDGGVHRESKIAGHSDSEMRGLRSGAGNIGCSVARHRLRERQPHAAHPQAGRLGTPGGRQWTDSDKTPMVLDGQPEEQD